MRFYHHINIYIKSKIHKKKKKKKKKFIIGKTSKKSRKTSYLRKKKRKLRLTRSLKSKEEEISDLQIQIIDFEKLAADSGESILYEVNKCSRENNNLVEWLKLYDEQIKNYQREIYNLNLKLYFSSSQQPQNQPQNQPQHQPQNHPQHHPQHQPQNHPQHHPQNQQLQPQQSPTFKSLADYFDYFKNQ